MKKLHLIYAAFILGSAMFWSGCSKNDNDNPDSDPKQEITMPKEAFQLQIVEAQFSQPLLQEEYDADLGGVPLKLVRAEDNTLVFYVPGTTALGTTTLYIPNLDVNTKFEVKESLLNGSEDVVLKPLFEDLSLIKSAITDEEYSAYLANTLTAFEEYYKSLSNDDKNQMALFYQVNESWFNEILNVNQPQGFTTLGVASTLVKTKKLLASVIIFAGSGYILALPGTGIEKSLVTVAGVTAGVLAWKYATELVNEINIVDRVVNQIQGNQITKTTFETQGISFTHNKAQNVHLYTGNRSVTASDQSNTAEGTGIFFDAYGRLTKATEKINNLIQFVNDHVFFANISKIPVHEIPDSAEIQSTALTTEDYKNLQFTVSDANVQLSDLAFENGAIRMKMTVKNPDTATGNSLKTTLNYTYQNEFSNTTGNMPIEIKLNKEGTFDLVGNWKLTIRINNNPPKIYNMEMDESGIWVIDQVQNPSADYQIEMRYNEGVIYLSFDGGEPYELEVNDVNDTVFETQGEDNDRGQIFYYYVKLERL